jgi:hypothetical protein
MSVEAVGAEGLAGANEVVRPLKQLNAAVYFHIFSWIM